VIQVRGEIGMVLFFIVLSYLSIQGEVVFSARPFEMQFYPRNSTDSATVGIMGEAINESGKQLTLNVYKNGSSMTDTTLNITTGTFSFSLSTRIHAELSEYLFTVFIGDSLVLKADSVVCGDAYIIAGQSNALSNAAGGSGPVNEWIRTFGRGNNNGSLTGDSALVKSDTVWGRGHAIRSTTDKLFFIGSLGFRLAERLITEKEIPICIINGAQGDTYIAQHLPNTSNPRLLSTIYGRLLYRTEKAGINNSAKAIVWYQGENDGTTNPTTYTTRFSTLYQSWKSHYPSVQQIYLFQLRNRKSLIPEAQRMITLQYPDITPLAAACEAELSTDAIHFTVSGYFKLADWLYGALDSGYTAPMIQRASFTDRALKTVKVRFDQPVRWGNDTTIIINSDTIKASLKDYFSFDTSYSVLDTGWASPLDSSIILRLKSESGSFSTISFLYARRYHPWSNETVYGNSYSGYHYRGPWLTNSRNMGAMLFTNIPLEFDTVNTDVDVNQPRKTISLVAYNNPASTVLKLFFNTVVDNQPLSIRMFNCKGELVKSYYYNDVPIKTLFVNVENLPAGVYALCLKYSSQQKEIIHRAVILR
jgi:lysophospholipase L1-like esterase